MAEAGAAYDEAVRVFPNALVVVNERGTFRRNSGNLEGAVEDFTRALQIDPAFAIGYINRAMCLNDLGNAQAAEGDFTQALSLPLDPTMQLLAYRLRAMARVIQGRADAGISDLSAAIKLMPTEAALYEERGYAHFFARNFPAAASNLSKALELNPQLTRIIPWLALSQSRSGKPAESQATLEAAEQAKIQPNAWVDRVNRYLAGQIAEDELVSSATDLAADGKTERMCEARFFIGQKKILTNQAERATDDFRQAAASKATALTAYRAARYELGEFQN
jgi:lipoprotein NlpI